MTQTIATMHHGGSWPPASNYTRIRWSSPESTRHTPPTSCGDRSEWKPEVQNPADEQATPRRSFSLLSPMVLCAINHSKIAQLVRWWSFDGMRGSWIRSYLYWNLKHIRADPSQLSFEFGGHGGQRGLRFSSRVCYGRPVRKMTSGPHMAVSRAEHVRSTGGETCPCCSARRDPRDCWAPRARLFRWEGTSV
jgi:hypothetical protein